MPSWGGCSPAGRGLLLLLGMDEEEEEGSPVMVDGRPVVLDDEVAAAAAAPAVLEPAPLTFQILILQSKELDIAKSPKSTGPFAPWKSNPVTGAVWPLYRIFPSTPAFAPARSYLWHGNIVPSSVPTRKEVGSVAGKDIHVGAKSSNFIGDKLCGWVNSRDSCGAVNMSVVHPQTTPSVEQDMMLFAFWVPTWLIL